MCLFLAGAAAVLPRAGFAADPEPEAAAQPRTGHRGAAKRGYDYDKSKYKAYKVLTEDENHSYRFDAKGNAILPAQAKRRSSKRKVRPRPPLSEEDAASAPKRKARPAPGNAGPPVAQTPVPRPKLAPAPEASATPAQ